ncbi:MAG: DUF1289 domain-containing protein [Methylococcaceae bacterium]|jgi:uncharacterized protein|nr:DUF1289 domain-containing protein [Methylococcaceae bacterium]
MADNEEEILSPCNGKCETDERDICTGCYRSVEEIVKWVRVDEKTREMYWKKIELRRKMYEDSEKSQ